MLPLEVRAYLSELIETTYTRSEIENLANKFGVEAAGRNKLLLAKDFLSKLSEKREIELEEVYQNENISCGRSPYDKFWIR